MNTTTQKKTPRRFRRALNWFMWGLAGLLLLFVLLAVVGAIWQRSAAASDALAFPPAGEMIDMGDHAMHLHCIGEGSPTVVLDTIADGISSYWTYIQPEIAQTTRVCSYDRSGLGWSELGTGGGDGITAAHELRALLQSAGEEGPYLLAGHSYGANVVRLFWSLYPEEVAGMVLIDPGTLYEDPRLPATMHEEQKTGEIIASAGRLLAPLGLFRASEMGLALASTLPAQQQAEFNAFFSSAGYWNAIARQNGAYAATSRQVAAVEEMGALPLLVLSADTPAGEARDAWNRVNAEIASLSSNGEARILQGTTHTGLAIDPQMAPTTAAAILEMVEQLR